jgi:DNA polymerase I-like protein with 3'-5' exonuclease and polymerase domains
LRVKEEDVEFTTKALKESINKVNAQYKFPVQIEVDVQTGNNYAEVH